MANNSTKTRVVYTLFSSNKAVVGQQVLSTLEDFAADAAKSYAKKEAQPLAVPDQLPDHSRGKGTQSISATSVFLDFDKTELSIAGAAKILNSMKAAYVIYPTYSWKPDASKFRVVLPLSGPIDVVERRHLIARLGMRLPGIAPETGDSKRGFYVGRNGTAAPAPVLRHGLTVERLALPDAPKPITAGSSVGVSLRDNPLAKAQEYMARLGHKLRDGEGRWACVEYMATRLSSRGYPEDQCWTWLGDIIARYFDARDITPEQRKQWEARISHWLAKDMPKRTEKPAGPRPRPVNHGQIKGLPTSFSLQELLDMELPATQWIFEGLLPPGLALIAGSPKVGKSQLMLDLALAAASGKPFLNKYQGHKCKTIYFDLESGHHLLRERVLPTMSARGITAKDVKGYMSFSLVMDTGVNAISQLRQELAADPAIRLVVIDLFARIRDSENKERKSVYQLDYDTMSQFQDVCAENPELCVLLVHHSNKRSSAMTDHWQDSISGSTGLAGATHTNMGMQRISKQGMSEEEQAHMKKFCMFHIAGKRVKDTELILKQAGDGVSWEISDKSLTEVRNTTLQSEILAVMTSDLERLWSSPEISAALGKSHNNNTIKNIIYRMQKRGEVVSPTGKGYTLTANAGKTTRGPKVGGAKKKAAPEGAA